MQKVITEIRVFDSLGNCTDDYKVKIPTTRVEKIKETTSYDRHTESYLTVAYCDGEECTKEYRFRN